MQKSLIIYKKMYTISGFMYIFSVFKYQTNKSFILIYLVSVHFKLYHKTRLVVRFFAYK